MPNKEEQVANSLFDPVTVRKVLKSLALSLAAAVSAFCVSYAQTENLKFSVLVAVPTFLAPFVPNTMNEYFSGKKK